MSPNTDICVADMNRIDELLRRLKGDVSEPERDSIVKEIVGLGPSGMAGLARRLPRRDDLSTEAACVFLWIGDEGLAFALKLARDESQPEEIQEGVLAVLFIFVKYGRGLEAFAELRRLETESPEEEVRMWARGWINRTTENALNLQDDSV